MMHARPASLARRLPAGAQASMMSRRRRHQVTFVAAGIYNLGWGAWIALWPAAFYATAGIPVPSHPEVAACLGMVIALYGVVYLEVARVPEHGWVPAAVGLTGKVLGPVGLAVQVATGDWPTTAVVVVIGNDLIWLIPFAAYLRDAWPSFRATWRPAALTTDQGWPPQSALAPDRTRAPGTLPTGPGR